MKADQNVKKYEWLGLIHGGMHTLRLKMNGAPQSFVDCKKLRIWILLKSQRRYTKCMFGTRDLKQWKGRRNGKKSSRHGHKVVCIIDVAVLL
eukprot:scaffold136603_cov23-Tisochrysis_lutea.AAC.2